MDKLVLNDKHMLDFQFIYIFVSFIFLNVNLDSQNCFGISQEILFIEVKLSMTVKQKLDSQFGFRKTETTSKKRMFTRKK